MAHPVFLAPGSYHEFNISSRNVRDNMITELQTKFPNDRIAQNLVKHLLNIDKHVLNQYNDILLVLENVGGTNIHFKTSRMETKELIYTIPSWNTEVPFEFQTHKKWWVWW